MEVVDLERRAKVATDLFEKGAALVKITDTGIEVDWREYSAITGGSKGTVSQTVKVNVSATAKASSSISVVFREIITQLQNYDIEPDKIPEAKIKLNTLEKELSKKNPRWNVVKQVLGWALDCSKELFLRLSVILAEYYVKGS